MRFMYLRILQNVIKTYSLGMIRGIQNNFLPLLKIKIEGLDLTPANSQCSLWSHCDWP